MIDGSSPKVFISYRRQGTQDFVRRLHGFLTNAYGKSNVFLDSSGLKVGDNFDKRLAVELSNSTIVLATIGTDWVGNKLLGKPRIAQKADWVRKEIEHALANNIPVLPILVGDASLPKERHLPPSLRGLLLVQVGRLRDDSWSADCEDLKHAIDGLIASSSEAESEAIVWRRIDRPIINHFSATLASGISALTLLAALTGAVLYPKVTHRYIGKSIEIQAAKTSAEKSDFMVDWQKTGETWDEWNGGIRFLSFGLISSRIDDVYCAAHSIQGLSITGPRCLRDSSHANAIEARQYEETLVNSVWTMSGIWSMCVVLLLTYFYARSARRATNT